MGQMVSSKIIIYNVRRVGTRTSGTESTHVAKILAKNVECLANVSFGGMGRYQFRPARPREGYKSKKTVNSLRGS